MDIPYKTCRCSSFETIVTQDPQILKCQCDCLKQLAKVWIDESIQTSGRRDLEVRMCT